MSNDFNFTREFFNHYEVNSTSESIQKYCLLWKSVIAQAIADAINTGKKNRKLGYKTQSTFMVVGLQSRFCIHMYTR